MGRSLPPAVPERGGETPRCPECGSGDLFLIEVTRRDGEAWRGAYCAGEYSRERRRFVRRSCGYAGETLRRDDVPSPLAGTPRPGG